MKSFLYTTVLIAFCSLTTFGQIYTGPIPKPTNGYGSDGSYTVSVQSFPNPNFPTEDIRIYYPSGITTSVPTLFYSHGHGGNNPLRVIGLLNFFAKKGYAIVFVPFQTTGVTIGDRYNNLIAGFHKAARDYPNIVDTTRVGFLGHSFGGGATIASAYKCFTANNWGQNGRFICPSAQWYSFNITQEELQSFPSDTKMLTFVFDNDNVNDHRMAVEIFNNINIAASEKDFVKVLPSTVSDYNYTAEHDMPSTYVAFDALDYYAYYRLIDALCDYTFNGSLEGKDVALGNGSINQITMPEGMANLFHSDSPVPTYPESVYGYPCSMLQNPRQAHCDEVVLATESSANERIEMFPNPASTMFFIETDKTISNVDIFNKQGQLVKKVNTKNIDISELPSGLYFVVVIFIDKILKIEKLVKK